MQTMPTDAAPKGSIPLYVSDHPAGMSIEVAAGLLEGEHATDAIPTRAGGSARSEA
jgi:hypothetical protein